MVFQPDMVGMVVSEMGRALAFYRALGLPIPEGAEAEDHVECTVNGYRLAWDTEALVRSFHPNWTPPVGQRISLAFLGESPAAVDAMYEKLTGLGYAGHTPPWDAFWGQRYAQITDPDGNIVDLFAAL